VKKIGKGSFSKFMEAPRDLGDPNRLRKKSGFVIARSEATKQSRVSDKKNEIASLPSVARNDIKLVFPQPAQGLFS
jgi:hypothetical protein